MATSGNFLTSDSGQGGGNYYGRMIFEWWRVGAGISGSVGYHNINYHLKTYGGSSSYWQYFYQGSMNVDGSGYSWGTTQAYGNGATVFGDYGKTLYTNGSGDRSFGASAQGGVYYNTINTSGSGSWALDHINLWGGVDYINVPSPLTDESSSVVVGWHNYAGTAHVWFRLDQINGSDATYHYVGPSNPTTWSGFATWVRTSMVNTNSSVLYIWYGDDIDNNSSVDNWQGPWTYAISIKNDTGQANPTFSNFTYLDTNSTTSTITGNDQVLIQGKSTLQTTVSVANKATANKQATMNSYTFSIGASSYIAGWSSGSNVVQSMGSASDVSGVQNLSVQATDSRTNYKTVTKNVTVLPYASPVFDPLLKVGYANNYDHSNGLTVTANGTTIAGISPMTLSGSDKNSVNTTTGVQFDVSKGNNTSYTGTYVNVTTARTAGSPNVTATLATVASSILTKMNALTYDNTVRWYVKFKIVDALETQYYETFIDIGKAIFRIGSDQKVYNKEEQLLVLPVVSVLYEDAAGTAVNGTGTITPWAATNIYVRHGTGTGNSSTIVFDVSFSYWASSSAGARTWALKLDGTAIGDSARKLYLNTLSNHTNVASTIVAKGVSAGSHTITLELYGGGLDVRTDTADFLTIISTEYANAYVTSSSGPLTAGTAADDGGAGTAWTSVNNAKVEDGSEAQCLNIGPGGGGGTANQLLLTNFGFAIPTNATIIGILMEAKVRDDATGSDTSGIYLRTNAGNVATKPNVGWGGSLAWVSWGGSGDTWGRTWTATEINHTNFGASLSNFPSTGTGNLFVDSCRITVYYI